LADGHDAELEWSRPWDRILDWQPPHAKWFGKLNASVNYGVTIFYTAPTRRANLLSPVPVSL
jgi:hypothetical protein